ncbi:MAG: cysteine desulfurase family protein [Terriglobales bacterium]
MLRAYLDNNASTPVRPEVVAAMLPFLHEGYGNASSVHQRGQAARAALEQARAHVAALIGARPAEVVFTSGGTEADNLAIWGVLADLPPGHVMTTAIEHHAVLFPFQELEKRGWTVTWLPVNAQGCIDPDDVRRALKPTTALVSVMMANNETGVIQPVAEVGKITRAAGVKLHVDAVQAAGKIPIAVEDLGCELLSLSGHKLHGPQGVGALYVRRGTALRPMLFGGRHERERRAGTENIPGIVGLGEASRLATAERVTSGERLAALRDHVESAILEAVPHAAVVGAGARTPNTTNICFADVDGEALVISLDLQGFCVSAGAACSSGAVDASHVLLAMGLSPARARSCLRFSLGKQNSTEEVAALLEVLPGLVARLRELSPSWSH